MNDEEKPVAFVTGASRGIGLAIVNRLLADGYQVAAFSRTFSPELLALAQRGEQLRFFALDLAEASGVTATALEACRSYGTVRVLVNSAGVAAGGLFSMTSPTLMREVFDVNYFNQILFTQYVVKKMTRCRSGSIINIGSTAGLRADAGTLAYASSKAAMMQATRVMAAELGAVGIRVNAVAPSVVETDMGQQMDDRARQMLSERSALTGLIDAEDVANLVAFLASAQSAKITGQILRVDRGLQ